MTDMINHKNIIIALLAIATFLSCDFVNNPTDVSPTTRTNTNAVTRKILIEDYTGHYCGQCPPAAEELHKIEVLYKGNIIGLAVHAGFFADPRHLYPTDFRNATGNAYDNLFGNSAAGNPNGLINRIGYPTSTHIKSWSSWASSVNSLINTPATFQLKLNNNFNPATRNLNTTITLTSLVKNTGIYKLVVLMSEDSIVAEQKDDRFNPSLMTNYIFNHVLRTSINSAWGDAVFLSGANTNDSIVKQYTNFYVNGAYKPEHCHVIAFVYDADPSSSSYHEVLQVEKESLIP